MAKAKVTAASFLKNLELPESEPTVDVTIENTKRQSGRAGLKHIGGYFDRDTTEMVAILRARLGLDNSQLIKRAIEELFHREDAARKFGDR